MPQPNQSKNPEGKIKHVLHNKIKQEDSTSRNYMFVTISPAMPNKKITNQEMYAVRRDHHIKLKVICYKNNMFPNHAAE